MSSAAAALPRVDGQHRNMALAAARRAGAVELRTLGWTYQQIADKLGYVNRGSVYQAVSKALQGRTHEEVDSLRDLETARLHALQQGVWDRAMNGDIAAAWAALRIIAARCRLLGLDANSLIQEPDRPRTVVVSKGR